MAMILEDASMNNDIEEPQLNSEQTTEDDHSYYSDDSGISPSSETYHSYSTHSSNRYKRKNKEDDPQGFDLAQRENQAVVIWRLVVISAMVLITIGASIAVFVYVDSKEQSAFEDNFDADAIKIFTDLQAGIVQRFVQLDTLATSMVSYVNVVGDTSMKWPFVTMPNFAIYASKARSSAGAIAVETFQYIPDEEDTEQENSSTTRSQWEQYTRENGNSWVRESIAVQLMDETYQGESWPENMVAVEHSKIWYGNDILPDNSGPYSPSWQAYPVAPGNESLYNWNAIMDPLFGPGIEHSFFQKQAVMTQALNLAGKTASPHIQYAAQHTAEWASKLSNQNTSAEEPLVRLIYPVLESSLLVQEEPSSVTAVSETVAIIASSFYFGTLLRGILPISQHGPVVVVKNECGEPFTYEINGPEAIYLGEGDLHDEHFESYGLSMNYTEMDELAARDGLNLSHSILPIAKSYCVYNITIYPSKEMEQMYRSNDPIIFTYSVIAIFLVTSLCFLGYDKLVADRQQKVLRSAQKSNAIISSLFPSNIRDRLFVEGANGSHDTAHIFQPTKARLKNFLHDEDDPSSSGGEMGIKSKPIADLFTDCTVMFADIANFTAWSSVREPGQVFTLLETLYGAFDQIAAKRGVFKVETIGDSYVAVAGLPEPRRDHAVVMIKFARDCRQQCLDICSQLEVSLGPETGDLSMRFGLHSGPVTAGVLRGEKSRFQLFGDTVNTAARMESHGLIGKIQVSQATADLLIEAKKEHWLEAREDKVEAKGKGLLQTYWVEPGGKFAKAPENLSDLIDYKTERLVNWNVVVLSRMLLDIMRHRQHQMPRGRTSISKGSVSWSQPHDKMVLHEVKEFIELPEFSPTSGPQKELDDISDVIKDQLYDYVTAIALTYHSNPFHNFEHASHVCMSVAKLLSRIMAADQVYDTETGDTRILASTLHDHTYGITSDPLTQFACVFSALIHDCDHPGVPNTQLVKENTEIAQQYQGKSVAEQNSVNLAWDLLLQDKYGDLRAAICETQAEEIRFRQLVVNAVMATDIMDKDLKKLRDDRWKKAFQKENVTPVSFTIENIIDENMDEMDSARKEAANRKATIVIEHLIQASDVAHTMQHWHIYRKWNERLFREMHKAYIDGRAEKDPVDFWYQGEIGFFDFYIIPLAKKLSECGVFGVSSDEYLNYAVMNRNEWEKKGMGIVEEMLDKMAQEMSASAVHEQVKEAAIQPTLPRTRAMEGNCK